MNALIHELRISFAQKANPKEAEKQNAYLKHLFIHFGLKTPVRRAITTPVINDLKVYSIHEIIEFATLCFAQSEREFHQLGTDVLIKYAKKLPETALPYIREKIETNSWWDTVDMLAAKVLGDFLKRYPKHLPQMDVWICDENLWIRRSAILYQLKYKEQTDAERLFRYCLQCAPEKEFFIRKVIGWTLREYAKVHRTAVEDFVHQYEKVLSPLSKKEALR